MSGGLEGGFRRRLVAEMKIEHGVIRRNVVHLRRAGFGGAGGVHLRGQYAIVHHDLLGGFARLCQSVGDDNRDMVADVAHLALGEGRMRPGLHRRAVFRVNHPAADQPADLVGGEIVTGKNAMHARHFARHAGVDFLECGVGVRRAQEIRVGLAMTIDIIGILALAGDVADVFLAFDRRADACRGHVSLSRRCVV